MSYVNLDTLPDDEDPIEEESREQSKSHVLKNHNLNKVAPVYRPDDSVATISRSVTSLKPQGQVEIGPPAIEDNQNLFYNQLRDEAYPINVRFIMWQDSNLGKFIEFKIKVLYMEGVDDS